MITVMKRIKLIMLTNLLFKLNIFVMEKENNINELKYAINVPRAAAIVPNSLIKK